jgi:hypothetical protein
VGTMKNSAGDEVTELGELPLKDRACPDCGQLRIVGHDANGDDCWVCVGFDCPPEKVGKVGRLERRHRSLVIDGESVLALLSPYAGKEILLTLSVFGEGLPRPEGSK